MAQLIIHQFPCLQDNYGFLIHDPVSGETATIDTPDADEINRQLAAKGWQLTQIWNTHFHWDHTGGNTALKEKWDCKISGPIAEGDRIPGRDVDLQEGDVVSLGAHQATVLETPGHTKGHIVFYLEKESVAFVGDTLFSLGCGRMFEGTPDQFWSSLSRLRDLPDDTTIYCAHEYTEANARFALTAEPENAALLTRIEDVKKLRLAGQATVPTTIGQEKQTNPFLRADFQTIKDQLNLTDAPPARVFAELRQRKDHF